MPLPGHFSVEIYMPRAGFEHDETLERRVIAAVRGELGAVAAHKTAFVAQQLPKTRSGKILRILLRKIVSGQEWTVPPTIDDPSIPATLAALVANHPNV